MPNWFRWRPTEYGIRVGFAIGQNADESCPATD
jgi:hypothetical protein